MTDKQTAKLIARVAENLPNDISKERMQEWIENPKDLQRILRRLCSATHSPAYTYDKCWDVWRTITIGGGWQKDALAVFLKNLEKRGYCIDGRARSILSSSSMRGSIGWGEGEVNLMSCTVSELGYESGASVRRIFNVVRSKGMFATAGVALHLRAQYADQPKGERLVVVMEPSMISPAESVLTVGHGDNGLYLGGEYARPGYEWSGDTRLVFVRLRRS